MTTIDFEVCKSFGIEPEPVLSTVFIFSSDELITWDSNDVCEKKIEIKKIRIDLILLVCI